MNLKETIKNLRERRKTEKEKKEERVQRQEINRNTFIQNGEIRVGEEECEKVKINYLN